VTDREPYVTVAEAIDGLSHVEPNGCGTEPNHVAPTQRQSTIDRCRDASWGEPLYESYKQNKRLHPHEPSPTVINYREKYAHPYLPRYITPRERARLQSFDDDYVFGGDGDSFANNSETPSRRNSQSH